MSVGTEFGLKSHTLSSDPVPWIALINRKEVNPVSPSTILYGFQQNVVWHLITNTIHRIEMQQQYFVFCHTPKTKQCMKLFRYEWRHCCRIIELISYCSSWPCLLGSGLVIFHLPTSGQTYLQISTCSQVASKATFDTCRYMYHRTTTCGTSPLIGKTLLRTQLDDNLI